MDTRRERSPNEVLAADSNLSASRLEITLDSMIVQGDPNLSDTMIETTVRNTNKLRESKLKTTFR